MGSLNSGPENWFLQCDGCAKGFHELCYTGPNALPSSKRRSSRAGVEAVAKWFCSKDCASSPGSSAKLGMFLTFAAKCETSPSISCVSSVFDGVSLPEHLLLPPPASSSSSSLSSFMLLSDDSLPNTTNAVLDLPKRNLPMMKPLSPTSPSSPVPISSSTTAVSAIPLKRSHKKKVPISQPTAHPPKRSHKKKVVPSESALAPPKRSHKKKTVTSDSVVAPPKRSHKKKVVSSDTFAKYGSSDSIRRTPSQSVSNDGDWSSVDGIRVPQFVKQGMSLSLRV